MKINELKTRAIFAGVFIAAHHGLSAVTLEALAEEVGVSRQRLGAVQPVADWHRDIVEQAAKSDVWPVLAEVITRSRWPQIAVTPEQLQGVANWIMEQGAAHVGQ
jgi:AmiR/NasT family two-component response regulator